MLQELKIVNFFQKWYQHGTAKTKLILKLFCFLNILFSFSFRDTFELNLIFEILMIVFDFIDSDGTILLLKKFSLNIFSLNIYLNYVIEFFFEEF